MRITFLAIYYCSQGHGAMNKKYIILTIACTVGVTVLCQQGHIIDKKEIRKLEKERRRDEKINAEARLGKIVAFLLDNQRFILEAQSVGDKSGRREPVSSNLNFVAVDSNEVLLQLGNHYGIGINGVGGFTVEGQVSNYLVRKHESKRGTSYFVILYVLSSYGPFDISMNVSSLGNADATVRGNGSGQLRFYGNLVPLENSTVYKGQVRYF